MAVLLCIHEPVCCSYLLCADSLPAQHSTLPSLPMLTYSCLYLPCFVVLFLAVVCPGKLTRAGTVFRGSLAWRAAAASAAHPAWRLLS